MIELKHVSASYGETKVLDAVDWRLDGGELCVVVGPNGAGKSTLLKVACGLLPASGALLDGESVASLAPKTRAQKVTLVHQQTESVFDYTCLDFVLMGAHARSGRFSFDSDADVAKAEEHLGTMGVGHLAARPFTSISGGESQRVVLARTLMTQAPCWLLDEPTASLDPKHQIASLDLVRRHVDADPSHCAAVILHDLNLAARYADRVTIVHDGKVAHDGPVADVLTSDTLSQIYDVEIVPVPYDGGTLFVTK